MLLHAYMYLYVYVCIPKCNLSSPCYLYYVFRTDGLSLDNKLACSSLGQISFLSSNFFSLANRSICKVEALWAFPCPLWHILVVIFVQVIFSLSCWWNFMNLFSVILASTSSQQTLCSSGPHIFSIHSSAICPDPYIYEWFVDVSTGTVFYNSAFSLVVVFCGDFNLLQR